MNEKQFPKIVSVTVLLDSDTNQKLISAAKLSGNSKGLEAGLRLTQHLNTVPELSKDSYWEILLPKES
ncbi:TPA: TraY domain-containing protein [Escherichia coli]|uniref:TraY domain-containing protein n=1 Tax=Escherichia coli TaxID=562 RepID=UPI0021D6537B|nr:TraY domain-containing protein [Escherichia coli]MCU7734250.1 TraY domain-containing protein [Escherichia coli]